MADERSTPEQEYDSYVAGGGPAGDEPDVLLDVPVLKVEELDLELEDLRVHVSLQTELAGLVKINVGVDAFLNKAKLNIKGVDAQALLKVRLDRILDTFDRALQAIDNNPEIVGELVRSAGGALSDEAAGRTIEETAERTDPAQEEAASDGELLSETVDGAGRTVRRTADGSGSIVEATLDDSGGVVDETVTGNVSDLPVEEEYVDDEGRTIGRMRDESGSVVERTLDEQGNIAGPPAGGFGSERNETGEADATEAARKRAGEVGVDLAGIQGTGSNGRILVRDVEKAASRGG